MFRLYRYIWRSCIIFVFPLCISAQEITELRIFNLTIDTFQPSGLKMNRSRVIWKDMNFGGNLYNLKFYNGQEIVKLDSGLTNFRSDIDGDFVAWNTPAEEVKAYNIRDWSTTVVDNSYNPGGDQPVAVHNGLLTYARPATGGGSEIVLRNLATGSDTTFSADLWNLQPDVHHGQIAWVGANTPDLNAPTDIYFFDGKTTRNLTNSANEKNQQPILKDGQVVWLSEEGSNQLIRLFTGDTVLTLAQVTVGGSTIIQGYDASDGAAVVGLTDIVANTSQVIIYDAGSNIFTSLVLPDSIATPHIDNRLVMWVEGRRQQGPRIKTYHLDTQSFNIFGSAYAAALDDEEYAWAFGEAVEYARPVTYEQLTLDAQNGWEQSRFKPIDGGSLVWGNFDNSTDMRLFYNDGFNTTQLTDSSITKDFVMANDGYTIWRHDFNFLWLYDGGNPPAQVVDSIQLENPYTAGGYVGFFGFYASDPNAVRYPFLYDIQSGTLTQLRQNQVFPWTVMCDGNSAVWQEGFLGDIVFYDGNTIITLSDSATDSDYSYRNGVVVWSESRNGIFQIMMHDVASGTTTQLTNSSTHQVIPATDGEHIIWFENPNFPLAPDDSLMWYYDIASGQLTKAGNFYRRGFKQVWLDNGKVGWWQGGKVFVYDGQSITQLTNEFQNTFDVFVDQETVVWRGALNPNSPIGDIFRGKLQPRVAFDALHIAGDAPLTVQFFNRSWQGDQTYLWDFGDGQSSTEKHPTHVYQNPGVYTVTLTVSGPTETTSESKINLIRVEGITGITTDHGNAPRRFALYQNYPNPFNPTTTIAFDLPHGSPEGHRRHKQARITLHVYDITGRKVRTLVNGQMAAGRHQVIWDGKNDTGQPVASGVYFYRLSISPLEGRLREDVQTRKMLLLR